MRVSSIGQCKLEGSQSNIYSNKFNRRKEHVNPGQRQPRIDENIRVVPARVAEPRSRHVGVCDKEKQRCGVTGPCPPCPPIVTVPIITLRMTCLLDLSHELLQSILGEVDGHDLAALNATCRAFNSFVNGNRILCKSVYLRAWVGEAKTGLLVYSTDVVDRILR
jgi:hypothetical protein